MSPTIFDPAPRTAPRLRVPALPRAIPRVPAAPTRGRATVAAAFWRALRATLEGIAHR